MSAVGVLLHLLVHPLRNLGGKNVHQCCGCQSSHRVVLDRTSRKVGVGHKSKVIDGSDEGAQVVLVVGRVDDLTKIAGT